MKLNLSKTGFLFLGFAAIFGYCISSAFARVFANGLLQNMNPIVFCFYTFTWGMFAFTIFNFRSLKILWQKVRNHKKTLLLVNLTTVGSWLFLAYPLKYLEPSMMSTITLGLGPVFCLLLATKNYKKNENPFWDYVISVALFGTICYVAKLCLAGETTVLNATFLNKITSLLCCTIVAASMTLGTFQTKRLIHSGFTSLDVLVSRFLLIVLVSGAITIFRLHNTHIVAGMLDKHIILASFTFVIIPLFLMQIAVRELEPITVSIIMPFMPVLTYFLERHNKIPFNHTTLYVILTVLFLILLGAFLRYRMESMPFKMVGSEPTA